MTRQKGKQPYKTVPEIAAPSVDDALAFLVQMDTGRIKDFSILSETLAQILTGPFLDQISAQLVAAAKAQSDCLVRGETIDADKALIEISKLLDAVAGSGRTQGDTIGTLDSSSGTDSAPDTLPPDIDASLITEFVLECRELLDRAESVLLSIESSPEDPESINTVFRAFHTIKGTSGFVGLKRISGLAHLAESLLSRVRNKEIALKNGYADLALRSVDMLKKLVSSLDGAKSGARFEVPAGFEELISLLSMPDTAADPQKQKSRNLEGEGLGPGWHQTAAESRQMERNAVEYDSSIRINTARLDNLIDLVGELVIAQSMVVQDPRLAGDDCHELLRKITHAGKIVRELQDLSMSMRTVPLRGTFQKLQRAVRDLARRNGKEVVLVTDDGGTEIDRQMVAILNEVLVHMVRNAIDHGIEAPEDRERCGKPRTGTVRVVAAYSGGTVVVDVRDDGRGLDRNKIFGKAVSAGIVDGRKTLTETEVFSLIFVPGLSTSEQITDLSGRGVGMDVVRKGIESLRGRIEITSSPGIGTCFTVRLPLTLAVTDGMLVRVGTERYIIPTISIHLCFRPEPDCVSSIAGRGELVKLRGEMMPLFRLHRLFGIRTAVEDPSDGLLVVVGDKERRCAILVDELLGQQQVVAKSLSKALGKIPGISGGAILGDGQVGLILDTLEIYHRFVAA